MIEGVIIKKTIGGNGTNVNRVRREHICHITDTQIEIAMASVLATALISTLTMEIKAQVLQIEFVEAVPTEHRVTVTINYLVRLILTVAPCTTETPFAKLVVTVLRGAMM